MPLCSLSATARVPGVKFLPSVHPVYFSVFLSLLARGVPELRLQVRIVWRRRSRCKAATDNLFVCHVSVHGGAARWGLSCQEGAVATPCASRPKAVTPWRVDSV